MPRSTVALVLPLLAIDGELLGSTERAPEEPAFDRVGEPLEATGGELFAFPGETAVVFQRIGLRHRAKVTSHQP
jgi:hypothetical protein